METRDKKDLGEDQIKLQEVYGAEDDQDGQIDESIFDDPAIKEVEDFFNHVGIDHETKKANKTFALDLVRQLKSGRLSFDLDSNQAIMKLKHALKPKNGDEITALKLHLNTGMREIMNATATLTDASIEKRFMAFAQAFTKHPKAYFINAENANGGFGLSPVDYNRLRAFLIFFLN